MNRVMTWQNNEAIQFAYKVIPQPILDRLHFDYLIGCDPVYIGFFDYDDTEDGRSYRDTACVAYPYHQKLNKDRQKTTIVTPKILSPIHIVHEIGHVLHEYLNFEHDAIPVTDYAKTDIREAFAEAFTAWLFYNYATIPLKTQHEIDNRTFALFQELARV